MPRVCFLNSGPESFTRRYQPSRLVPQVLGTFLPWATREWETRKRRETRQTRFIVWLLWIYAVGRHLFLIIRPSPKGRPLQECNGVCLLSVVVIV